MGSVNITTILDNVSKAIESLPNRVATTAVNFSKQRFVKQNWQDTEEEPWKGRSRSRKGGSKRQRGAVLVDSGRLKKSIRVIDASKERVVIGTDVPYAQMHNDGLEAPVSVKVHTRRSRKGKSFTVKAHTRNVKMPKRQFLGESQALANQIEEMIYNEIEKAIKQ